MIISSSMHKIYVSYAYTYKYVILQYASALSDLRQSYANDT